MLQSMGSQKARYDSVTKQQQIWFFGKKKKKISKSDKHLAKLTKRKSEKMQLQIVQEYALASANMTHL